MSTSDFRCFPSRKGFLTLQPIIAPSAFSCGSTVGRLRIKSHSNSARPFKSVSICLPYIAVVVSAPVSSSKLQPARR
jgi:hypothetical protein